MDLWTTDEENSALRRSAAAAAFPNLASSSKKSALGDRMPSDGPASIAGPASYCTAAILVTLVLEELGM